jgi:hypothetical protein
VPLFDLKHVPRVPRSPEQYTRENPDRIKEFPEEIKKILIDPDELNQLMDQSQDNGWRHELDHDVESVFWLLLYWAMVARPEGGQEEDILPDAWTSLIGHFKPREELVWRLSSGDRRDILTHSVYKPLCPLISSLAAVIVVDRHWLPESDVRKRPGYICEAFQRLILEFILSNRNENFMTCRFDDSLRMVQGVAEPLTTTPSELRDGSETEESMGELDSGIETE